ncbi:MAG TPA: GatB/YqeY domain-containing protein [Gemmatimonadales bacterium]|nr:GatB/YqeY domain-containing protein [Gemmatimonadales bacterium]
MSAAHNVASLPERLRAAMNEARKHRDQPRTLLLSTVLADLKNREFELQHAPSDDETVEVLRRAIKRRREAAEQYTAAGRADRADAELAEVKALDAFLPAAVEPEEIRRAVREAIASGAKDLGKVMGQVMPRFKGRADGKVVNQIVREELAAAV